jgi:hypothetical protein
MRLPSAMITTWSTTSFRSAASTGWLHHDMHGTLASSEKLLDESRGFHMERAMHAGKECGIMAGSTQVVPAPLLQDGAGHSPGGGARRAAGAPDGAGRAQPPAQLLRHSGGPREQHRAAGRHHPHDHHRP